MKTREDLHYYDGPLGGVLRDDDKLQYFQIRDDSALYPDEDHPEGRVYDVWDIDAEPTDDDFDGAWWRPPGPPGGSITEDALYDQYPHE